jgi:hypothetical protein
MSNELRCKLSRDGEGTVMSDALRNMGFKPDTRKDVERDLARAIAKLGHGAEADRRTYAELQGVIERDSDYLYNLLLSKHKKVGDRK